MKALPFSSKWLTILSRRASIAWISIFVRYSSIAKANLGSLRPFISSSNARSHRVRFLGSRMSCEMRNARL